MQAAKQNKQPLLSNWKSLNEDVENYDQRSKASRTSRTSQRSNMSQSTRMKRLESYKLALNKSEDAFYQWIACAKYLNCIGAIFSLIFLSWMSLLVWTPLIYVCSYYEKHTEDNIEKIKFKNQMKVYCYVFLAIIQIFWIFSCLFDNFLVTMCINGMQMFLLWVIKGKLSNPIDKATFLEYQRDPVNKVVAGAAVDFFNKEVIKNLGKVESKTGKDQKASIIDKYDKEYPQAAQKQSFQVSKQILKDMNQSNDTMQMLDLAGQTLVNAQRIIKEKIENLEKQATRQQYKLSTSIDQSTNPNSQSDDKIYVFILNHQLKKEINKYVGATLQKQCFVIQEKAILAVRIHSA